jgi:hypothetical protein
MRKITKCKVALMEKDATVKIEEASKEAFILKSSGTFLPEEYLLKNGQERELDFSVEEYKEFIQNSIAAIYGDLISSSKNKVTDSVGIWLTFDDGNTVETSMDISTMDLIGGSYDINPIYELAKMLLDTAYESPEGQ